MKDLIIEFISKETQHSEYDWANLNHQNDRVGKVRCKIESDKITIFSINVFPEFEGHGYGKAFVEYCKNNFSVVVADRVRFSAIGFWEKTGFYPLEDGNYEYSKK